jgi:hypothetical protein
VDLVEIHHRCRHTSHEPAALVRDIALVEAQRAPLLHGSRRSAQRTGECRTHVADTALDGCRWLILADRGEMSVADGSVALYDSLIETYRKAGLLPA